MAVKFRIASNGEETIAELGGRGISRGITGARFIHNTTDGREVGLQLDISLDDFQFMEEGWFDKAYKAMQKLPDDDGAIIRLPSRLSMMMEAMEEKAGSEQEAWLNGK